MRQIFLIFIFCLPFIVRGQDPQIDQEKIGLLRSLRIFRDNLNNCENNNGCAQLTKKVNALIDLAKSLNDMAELSGMKNYIDYSQHVLDATSGDKKAAFIYSMNDDLSLKLGSEKDIGYLGLEAAASFAKKTVLIEVFIPENAKCGNCRLYWALFHGRDIDSLIRHDMFLDKSNTYTNPYSIELSIPCYVSFWLKDDLTTKKYKLTDSYTIIRKPSKISLTFFETK